MYSMCSTALVDGQLVFLKYLNTVFYLAIAQLYLVLSYRLNEDGR